MDIAYTAAITSANEIAVGLTGRSSDQDARLDSSSDPPIMTGRQMTTATAARICCRVDGVTRP